MDTCIYVAESLHCSSEIITTLLTDCTPVLKKFRLVEFFCNYLKYFSHKSNIAETHKSNAVEL